MRVDPEVVVKWLSQYHARRSFIVANGQLETNPVKLPVLVDNQIIPTRLVDTLGGDSTLVVFIPLPKQTYLGAILQEQGGWWLPVVSPKNVLHEAIFTGSILSYLQLLNHLARPS